MRAAQARPRYLTRVVCEVLLSTGLRVSEFISLSADAVVLIGAGHWLYVPVGKLHDDRYLPLHPHLLTLIDDYRQGIRPPGPSAVAAPRKRSSARPAHRHPLDQQGCGLRRAGPHPSTPTASYPGHPSDQPRYELGNNRRATRSPQPRHDPALRHTVLLVSEAKESASVNDSASRVMIDCRGAG